MNFLDLAISTLGPAILFILMTVMAFTAKKNIEKSKVLIKIKIKEKMK